MGIKQTSSAADGIGKGVVIASVVMITLLAGGMVLGNFLDWIGVKLF